MSASKEERTIRYPYGNPIGASDLPLEHPRRSQKITGFSKPFAIPKHILRIEAKRGAIRTGWQIRYERQGDGDKMFFSDSHYEYDPAKSLIAAENQLNAIMTKAENESLSKEHDNRVQNFNKRQGLHIPGLSLITDSGDDGKQNLYIEVEENGQRVFAGSRDNISHATLQHAIIEAQRIRNVFRSVAA